VGDVDVNQLGVRVQQGNHALLKAHVLIQESQDGPERVLQVQGPGERGGDFRQQFDIRLFAPHHRRTSHQAAGIWSTLT